jgi:hypothetical protein
MTMVGGYQHFRKMLRFYLPRKVSQVEKVAGYMKEGRKRIDNKDKSDQSQP